MNRYFLRTSLILSSLVLLSFLSCGESDPCASSNWEGRWGGLINCLGIDVTLAITISEDREDAVEVNLGSELKLVPIRDCMINFQTERRVDGNDFLIDLTLSLNEDALDVLNASMDFSGFGNMETCKGVLTRR